MTMNVRSESDSLKTIELEERTEMSRGTTKVYSAVLRYSSGEEIRGLAKLFTSTEAANKEKTILGLLEERQVAGIARVLEVLNPTQEINGGVSLIVESEVEGVPLGYNPKPVLLEEVRSKSSGLFEQLGAVSGDNYLMNNEVGYCGDISSRNVIDTGSRYVIVDWGTRLGWPDSFVTRGYTAPEVLDPKAEELSYVNADTYSLGCLMARVLLGKVVFDGLIEGCRTGGCVKYEQVEGLVDPEARDFFRVVLSMDPLDRVLSEDPTDHYRKLAHLFGTRNY
jgi:serine/threonine protein kinase